MRLDRTTRGRNNLANYSYRELEFLLLPETQLNQVDHPAVRRELSKRSNKRARALRWLERKRNQ